MNSSAIDIQEARAESVTVIEDALTVDLVDRRAIIVPWSGTPVCGMAHLGSAVILMFGDGAYIHWPDLDGDLTVAGLLAGRRWVESPQSLQKRLKAQDPRISSEGTS